MQISAVDPSGFGEGERFIGSLAATTDDLGNAAFALTLPSTVTAVDFITATATDPNNSTSEFSAAIAGTRTDPPPTDPPPTDPPQPFADVRIRVSGKSLVIQGSSWDDLIRVEAAGPEAFRVSPGNGTLINGQTEPVLFTGVTRGMQVRLGNGNDSILLDATNNSFTFAGGLSIEAGAGDDTIRLNGVIIRGRTNLNVGLGNDRVNIVDSILSREFGLISGPGADTIAFDHTHFFRQVLIEARRRQDLIDLGNCFFEIPPVVTESAFRIDLRGSPFPQL